MVLLLLLGLGLQLQASPQLQDSAPNSLAVCPFSTSMCVGLPRKLCSLAMAPQQPATQDTAVKFNCQTLHPFTCNWPQGHHAAC